MTTPIGNSADRHQLALPVMMLAVVAFSFAPLVISSGGNNPFMINLFWRIGLITGYASFLLLFARPLIFNSECRGLIRERLFALRKMGNWRNMSYLAFPLAVVGNFDSALFVFATKYTDVAIIAVLFETWPIFYMLIAARILWNERGPDQRIHWFPMAFLVGVAFVGLVFVYAGQREGGVLEFVLGLADWNQVGIVVLALGAAFLGAFPAFSFRWGMDLSREVAPTVGRGPKDKAFQLACITLATMLANVVSIPFSLGVGLGLGEDLPYHHLFLHNIVLLIVIGGVIAYSMPTILWRLANLLSPQNQGINALAFLIPVLSVVWLVSFGEVNLGSWDYFIMGTLAIITANLLINFQAEVRWGFKALLLTLGTAGAVVYLRDGAFENLNVDKWHWTAGGYFEALALSATVFTLLLAFRVSRLITRSGQEESLTFSIFRKVELLVRRRVLDSRIRECVLRMDTPETQADLKNAYMEARNYINQARGDGESLEAPDLQWLSEAEASLDDLARSKQQDITPGEMFALIIFAGITISLALLSRPPEAEGWNRFLVDVFAMLISGVIFFLVVNVWDLRRERDETKFLIVDGRVDYTVRFPDGKDRSFDQKLSIVVGGLITLVYAGLLAHKWVGWIPWLG